MRYLLAALLALAPLSPAMAQIDTAIDRTEMNDMLRASKIPEALAILDPILDVFERRYAPGTRPRLCQDGAGDGAETRRPGPTDVEIVDGDWCYALWAKGYALADIRDFRGALPFLERATTMQPGDSSYLSELGFVYGELARWDAALDAFTRAAAAAERLRGGDRTHELTRAWFGMGYVLIELGRWDEAETLFNRLLKLDPNSERAKHELDYIRDNRP